VWDSRYQYNAINTGCFLCGPIVAASPDGSAVYVTGYTNGSTDGSSIVYEATVAYDALTGLQEGAAFEQPASAQPVEQESQFGNTPSGIAVSGDSSRMFVATYVDDQIGSGTDQNGLVVLEYDVGSPVAQAPESPSGLLLLVVGGGGCALPILRKRSRTIRRAA
jgi:DNA-binding beta-propeller fold protein YncE